MRYKEEKIRPFRGSSLKQMKDFAVVPAVLLFVIGGGTYIDYTQFCDCIENLEKEERAGKTDNVILKLFGIER